MNKPTRPEPAQFGTFAVPGNGSCLIYEARHLFVEVDPDFRTLDHNVHGPDVEWVHTRVFEVMSSGTLAHQLYSIRRYLSRAYPELQISDLLLTQPQIVGFTQRHLVRLGQRYAGSMVFLPFADKKHVWFAGIRRLIGEIRFEVSAHRFAGVPGQDQALKRERGHCIIVRVPEPSEDPEAC